jgi:hypothetical protein
LFEWSTGFPEVTEPPEGAPGTFWAAQRIIESGKVLLIRMSDAAIIHGVIAVPAKAERYCRDRNLCPERHPDIAEELASRVFSESDWNPHTIKKEYPVRAAKRKR